MARRLIVELVGDERSAVRSFQRTSAAATGLERNLGRATRGALAGSGIFRSLGRSIAFASGGFLAFATAGDFLRKSVDAAREQQVVQKQLSVQLRNSGKAFADYRGQIEATSSRLSALSGFENDQLDAALTTILRTTGDVSKALRDEATAADLARARHISLAQAALVIAKTEAGNTTLLRRQGFQIAKNATAEQALAKVRQVVAGQARAGTTAAERFGAVLHNTEEIIGGALLPVLNRYLTSGTRWLEQMNESGRLQQDVASASRAVSRAVHDVTAVIEAATAAIRGIDRVTGSFENTLKDVAAIWLLVKIRTTAIKWGLIAAGERQVGTAAAISAGEVSSLEASLGRLKALGPIGVAIALSVVPSAKATKNPNAPSNNPVAKFFAGLPIVGGVFSQANKLGDITSNALGLTPPPPKVKSGFTGARSAFEPGGSLNALTILQQTANTQVNSTLKNAAKRHIGLLGQFNLLELKLADAQRTGNTILQRSILVSEESILLNLRSQAKKLSDRTRFAQQAASVADQIRGIDAAAAAAAKKTRDTAKKAAAAAAKAAQGFEVPLRLQVEQARLEALGKPTTAILNRTKQAAQKALKSSHLGLQGQLDAWTTIAQINDQLHQGVQGALTKFRHVSTANLLAGLGLTGDQLRAARVRLAQVGAGGTVPPGRTPAFATATGVTINGGLHLHGVQNLRDLEDQLNKRAGSRPGRRRGA